MSVLRYVLSTCGILGHAFSAQTTGQTKGQVLLPIPAPVLVSVLEGSYEMQDLPKLGGA